MAAGGGNSSGSAWRMEDLQELALADDLQSGLHLSGINTDFKLAPRHHSKYSSHDTLNEALLATGAVRNDC